MRYFVGFISLVILMSSNLALAGSGEEITWKDLAPTDTKLPSAAELTRGMSIQQKMDFQLVRDFAGKATGTALDPTVTEEEATAAQIRLAASGFDAYSMAKTFTDRQSQAWHAQIDLKRRQVEGKSLRMEGFLLPVIGEVSTSPRYLLVPNVGACVHNPVPVYQAIIVEGADYAATSSFEAVVVEGLVRVEMQSVSAFVVDGTTSVKSAYAISGAKIKPSIEQLLQDISN